MMPLTADLKQEGTKQLAADLEREGVCEGEPATPAGGRDRGGGVGGEESRSCLF